MRNITVTFDDGTTHVYQNAPDDVTPEQITQRAQSEFGKSITKLDGGRSGAPAVVPDPVAPKKQPIPQKPSMMERVTRGVYDPIEGGAQVLYNALPQSVQTAGNDINNWLADKTGMVPRLPEGGLNEAIASGEKDYQTRFGGGFDTARMVGNVVSPVNIAAVSKLPQVASLGGRMLTGGGYGAMNSMLMPVTQGNYAEEKAKQGGLGLAAGAALAPVAGAVSRVVSPKASVNPDVRLMRKEGVPMTVGQAAGGALNRMEEKAQSLPFLGDAITSARENAREGFNRAAINRAVRPVGQKVDKVGTEGVKRAGDILSDAYDDALKGLGGVTLNNTHATNINNVITAAETNLPDTARNIFTKKLNQAMGGTRISPSNGMTAETFKKIDSDLGKFASNYSNSTVSSEREVGDALLEVQHQLRQQVANSSPAYAKALREADKGWANLTRVEQAAVSAKLNDGVFTPGQLMGAVLKGDKTVRDRSTARGTSLMQDLAKAGQNTIGNKYPDSGTAGRGLMITPLMDQAIGLPLLAGMPLYSQQAQRAGVAALTNRPDFSPMLADIIRNSAPGLSPVGYGLLNTR